MKHSFFLSAMLACTLCTAAYGQTSYVLDKNDNASSDEYYLDRKLRENRQQNKAMAGIITRFGYAFNYDAFTYGVSLVYSWNGLLGVTVGFDGYYIPNKLVYRTIPNDTVSSRIFSLPLWNMRAGLMLGRYFMLGAVLGKANVGDANNLINLRQDAWFVNNEDSQFMYGGFITGLLPVSKHFGFNVDFAVTNKTGFNVALGFNITIPVK